MTIDLYRVIFRVASALEVPVIIAALLALALVLVEAGAFARELFARRRRGSGASGVDALTAAVGAGDRSPASLAAISWSAAMDVALAAIAGHVADGPDATDAAVAKDLADFDLGRQKRLGRTRILVRLGPALGLMGTLIPLTPALDGLARGNVTVLTDNLRIAFSVTVLGIFVGAVAFVISLTRERIYAQDYSDLEYVAALLTDERASA